ncbi:hypothetical protein [Nocardia sp. NPDC051750]|uniref:hypothetical protein n=1 Tax=Nocardia sp. NPDC051750 TaxID=3364325 RepID=UPI0037B84927
MNEGLNDLRKTTVVQLFAPVDGPAVPEPDDLPTIQPISADLVGRTVAGLAIAGRLLRRETARTGKRVSTCDPEETTNLIVEWGISLAWSDNPVVAYVDGALLDSTLRALAAAVACLGIGEEPDDRADLAELHHTLGDTILALHTPLWRRPEL